MAPRYVEQPVPAALLPDLGPAAVPWAADESLLLPGMAERLARAPGCAAFILKPAALGGLDRALAIASIGAAAGIDLVVTHFVDGPVLAIAAAAELARAYRGRRSPAGSNPIRAWRLSPPRARSRSVGGLARSGRGGAPGLGFSEEARRRWRGTR